MCELLKGIPYKKNRQKLAYMSCFRLISTILRGAIKNVLEREREWNERGEIFPIENTEFSRLTRIDFWCRKLSK